MTSVALPLSTNAVIPFLCKAGEEQTPKHPKFFIFVNIWICIYVGEFWSLVQGPLATLNEFEEYFFHLSKNSHGILVRCALKKYATSRNIELMICHGHFFFPNKSLVWIQRPQHKNVSRGSHIHFPGNQAVWNYRLSLSPSDAISTQDHSNPTTKYRHHLYTKVLILSKLEMIIPGS